MIEHDTSACQAEIARLVLENRSLRALLREVEHFGYLEGDFKPEMHDPDDCVKCRYDSGRLPDLPEPTRTLL